MQEILWRKKNLEIKLRTGEKTKKCRHKLITLLLWIKTNSNYEQNLIVVTKILSKIFSEVNLTLA